MTADEYGGGKDRRSYDETARKMADDARSRADVAAKEVAVFATKLDDHLIACEKSSDRVDSALTQVRRLLWGLLISLLGGLLYYFIRSGS